MHDMFIQSQQLVTSSSNSSSSGVVQPKKRKAEHYSTNNTNCGGELSLVEAVFAVTGNQLTDIDNNHASPSAGSNSQLLVRGSTIKLLDTYQRCGQKVKIHVLSCLKF